MTPAEQALALAVIASARELCEVDETGGSKVASGHMGQLVAERRLATEGLRASLRAFDAASGRAIRKRAKVQTP